MGSRWGMLAVKARRFGWLSELCNLIIFLASQNQSVFACILALDVRFSAQDFPGCKYKLVTSLTARFWRQSKEEMLVAEIQGCHAGAA